MLLLNVDKINKGKIWNKIDAFFQLYNNPRKRFDLFVHFGFYFGSSCEQLWIGI